MSKTMRKLLLRLKEEMFQRSISSISSSSIRSSKHNNKKGSNGNSSNLNPSNMPFFLPNRSPPHPSSSPTYPLPLETLSWTKL